MQHTIFTLCSQLIENGSIVCKLPSQLTKSWEDKIYIFHAIGYISSKLWTEKRKCIHSLGCNYMSTSTEDHVVLRHYVSSSHGNAKSNPYCSGEKKPTISICYLLY